MHALSTIPTSVYVFSICFLSVALLVLVLGHILYNDHKIEKFRKEALEHTMVAIEQLKADLREEAAINAIVDCTMIQKRGKKNG